MSADLTYRKRISVATLFGVVAGIVCYLGALTLGMSVSALHFLFIIVNRTLIGFVIGISGLRLKSKWHYHGILLGFIVGLPFFLFDLLMGMDLLVVLLVPVINCAFGLMIEFFTTVVFNAPQESNP